MINLQYNYPESMEAAVEKLKTDLPRRTLDYIRDTPEEKLIMFHYGLGSTIRNILELSQGENLKLMEDCGSDDPNESFAFVLWMLWRNLNE